MTDVVIVEAVRTPMGRGNQRNGDLRDVHPVLLAAHVLREVTGRAGIDPAMVGTSSSGASADRRAVGQHRAPGGARRGVPDRGPRNHRRPAVRLVAAGDPFRGQPHPVGRVRHHHRRGRREHEPRAHGDHRVPGSGHAVPAGVARGLQPRAPGAVRRDDRRACGTSPASRRTSLRRDRNAAPAMPRRTGRFDREIAPVVVGANGDGRVISQDQGIRPDTTVESLAALQPAFKPDGILHAGNSSQITDGAAAVLLMSLERATALGITPRARIAGQTVVGVDPVTMLTGPIPATDEAARAIRAEDRRHRPLRDQRGVRAGGPRLGAASITPTWSG